jgi:NADH-dependent peroxiredoxin subunit C
MSENIPLRVGQKVPACEIEVYDPVEGDFGKFNFEKAKSDQKWTILFFYPADFTFV